MNPAEPVVLRPHHGFCIRHFTGKGYSEAFVENMTRVAAALSADPSREIRLRIGPDCLCGSCPHNANGVCDSQEKVLGYDNACLKLCGLRDGQSLSWQAFQGAVGRAIGRNGLTAICPGCQWLPLCLRQIGEKGPAPGTFQ
jgi:hypothetical protein